MATEKDPTLLSIIFGCASVLVAMFAMIGYMVWTTHTQTMKRLELCASGRIEACAR